MVGCALGSSRLWFTIGGGIVNEVYYPRVDLPQIRDLGFIVADGAGFWVEVKRLWQHVGASWPRPARRRCASSTATSASSWRCASCPCEHRDVLLIEVTLTRRRRRCARTRCSRRTSAAPV